MRSSDDRPEPYRLPQCVEAVVVSPAPASVDDALYVVVPVFDGGRHRWGPCAGWQPRDGVLPAPGDRAALILADDTGGDEPWVAAWQPA